MHTALVICAYFSMILVPCACATWGDVLTAEWWQLKLAERRARKAAPALSPLVVAARREMLALKVEALARVAFTEPHAIPVLASKPAKTKTFRRTMPQRAAADPAAFDKLAARVAARLQALSEAAALAQREQATDFDSAAPATVATPAMAASTVHRRPPTPMRPTHEFESRPANAPSRAHSSDSDISIAA